MAVHKYQRKDGATVYCAAYFGPDGTRRVEKVKTVPALRADGKPTAKKEFLRAADAARNKANEQRAAVENGTWQPRDGEKGPRRLLFAKLVEKFLKEYQSKSGDMTFFEQRSKAWLAFFGDKPVQAITPAEVAKFRKWREVTPLKAAPKDEGKASEDTKTEDAKTAAKERKPPRPAGPSTVKKDLSALSTLFRWARKRGLVQANPADADLVKRPSEPKGCVEYLTPEQEQKVVDSAATWLKQVILWAINTGMDRSDIVALTWRDVDLKAGVVHAPRGKTGVARKIPLNTTLRAILAECDKLRTVDPSQPVFLDDKAVPVRINQIKLAMAHVYKKAGFRPSEPFKVFRHTFASRLAMRGVPAKVIAELMGHTEASITETYMHLAPGILRDAMALLDSDLHRALHKTPEAKVS